jgi:hypothetical protein
LEVKIFPLVPGDGKLVCPVPPTSAVTVVSAIIYPIK